MTMYDFAFAGSGFAASVAAAVLQKQGYQCLLLEKQQHPRFTIGESSTPIADQILLDLAEDFQLPSLGSLARWKTAAQIPEVTVGCKQGFSYFFHQREVSEPVYRLLVPASPNQEAADSHWLRSSVDHFLVQHAVSQGAELQENTQVQDLQRTDQGWTLQLKTPAGSRRCEAKFVIDSSGSAALGPWLEAAPVSRPLETQSACVYAHFEKEVDWEKQWQQWNLQSDDFSFPAQHAAIHHVVADGWLWHLGFDNHRISLGWVLSLPHTKNLPTDSVSQDSLLCWWRERLANYPSLQSLYGNLRPITPFKYLPHLQRLTFPSAGDGWLALPSAAGFVDPLHSTGIAHSMTAVQKLVYHTAAEGIPQTTFLNRYWQQLQREFWVLDQLAAMAYSSLDDPLKWECATMIYFAAAIQMEEARDRRRNSKSDSQSGLPIGAQLSSPPSFLLADDPLWLDRVARARQLLKRRSPPSTGWLAATADILDGYNSAGLAQSAANGIYHYTTANK